MNITSEHTNISSQENDNICLISGDIIDNTAIKLECNHKFIYYYIFNEVLNQKNNINKYDRTLKVNEIKCPYCRNIQKKILPYRLSVGCDKKIYGVNYPKKYCMNNIPCCYIFKKGIKKGKQCSNESIDVYCKMHMKYKNPHNNNNKCITINP